jgi:acetate---CoA ligase (ADP-forming)
MTNTANSTSVTHVDALLHARSVCVVGASPNQGGLGGQALERLQRHGFDGRIDLVNPRYNAIDNRPCYPSVADLPQAVDAAIICVRADQVAEVVRQCGDKGIHVAVVIASGFEEAFDGDERARELREAVQDSGVRIVGPNTEGVWSIPSRVFLTFGTASMRPKFLEGPVSVISQSGGIGTSIIRQLQDRGIGARYFIGVGNETDLTALDYFEQIVWEGVPGTVVFYTEGLTDGHRLPGLMAQARKAGIRVVALRAGTSELGRSATASHTGRIASAARVYTDVLRQLGVIDVHCFTDAWRAAETLTVAGSINGQPGNAASVGVVSVSGGCRGLIADAAHRFNVPFASLSDATVAKLREWLPSYAIAENPVDPTGSVLREPVLLSRILELVSADPAVHLTILQLGNSAPKQIIEQAEVFATVRRNSRKPLIVSTIGDDVALGKRAALNAAGVLLATDPEEAVLRCSWILASHQGKR